MTSVAASELRRRAADILNRVAYQGDRIGIVCYGKTVAVLVPVDDLARLRALDRIDVREARKALKAAKPPARRRLGSAATRKAAARKAATTRRTAGGLIP